MENLAHLEIEEPVYQEYAVVTDSKGEKLTVQAGGETYTARRAASCLILPKIGDRVLLSRQRNGDCFILAVLQTGTPSQTTISVPGDLHLELSSGKLQVAVQRGIELATAKHLQAVASHLKLDALSAKFRISRLIFEGGLLQASIESVRWVAESLESVVNRLVQRAKRAFRSVEEDELVKVGHLDITASRLMSLSGEYTVITANEDVKIDAERIHIG